MSTSSYVFTNKQKSSRVGEEKPNYSTSKNTGFTPWTWSNNDRLVRYPQNNGIVDYDSEQECSNESDLKKQIEIVTKIRQELVDRSSGGRKKDYLRSIQDRDQHLDYLRQRLELVRSTQLPEPPNSQAVDETEPESTAVVDAEELTEEEERDRTHLERKVERAFYEAGKALQQLRDRKLYRSTHGTFEEYCRDRFGFERRHPYRLIDAATVVDNLSPPMCPNWTQTENGLDEPPMCPNWTQTENGLDEPPMCPNWTQTENGLDEPPMCPNWTQTENGLDEPPMCPNWTQTEAGLSEPPMCPNWTQTENGLSEPPMCTNWTQIQNQDLITNWTQILPTNEFQVRSLTQLEPEQQRSIWQQAVQASGGKIPSGRVVKDIVQQIMEKTKVPNPYRVGEVCQIIPKDNPDLRGKGGCWGIVQNVGDFSCTVMAWDGEYTVRIDHLKLFEYSDVECEQMRGICDRMTRLRNGGFLEPTAQALLKQLGELKRPYLTPLEEKLLQLVEVEYGV